MDFKDISVPEIYKSSQDFRFFLDWFNEALSKIKYDIENLSDIYDPLRCPSNLLWALADTMGYKYDDRLPTSFNRLVLMYFMDMIRNKGSKNGVTLAAETNLAQFNILMQAGGYTDENNITHKGNKILYERLDNTSIPVNSVYVTAHTDKGYIDIVYFSTKMPKDACIEYVRPLGMYCFQHAGVKFDARTKLSVDARLTNINDVNERNQYNMTFGPTQVAHYTREDYARLQKTVDQELDLSKLNLTNWDKNLEFPITATFNEETSENIIQYTTVTHYERFYTVVDNIQPNTDYILTFDFCTPSGFSWGNYENRQDVCLFVVPGSQIDKLNDNSKGFLNPGLGLTILARSDKFNVSPNDNYTKYTLSFNSGNNNSICISLDFGYIKDGTLTEFKFKGLELRRDILNVSPMNDTRHTRREVWQSNKANEVTTNPLLNPAYRAVYSLQLSNNEQIVKSLIDIDPIFSLGYGPTNIHTSYPDDYLKHIYQDHYADGTVVTNKPWNLRYDKELEESITPNVYTSDAGSSAIISPESLSIAAWYNDTIQVSSSYTSKNLNDSGELIVVNNQIEIFVTHYLSKNTTSDNLRIRITNLRWDISSTGTGNLNIIESDYDLNGSTNSNGPDILTTNPNTKVYKYVLDFSDIESVNSMTLWRTYHLDKYNDEIGDWDLDIVKSESRGKSFRLLNIGLNTIPQVNPSMTALGDSISMNSMNTQYTDIQSNSKIRVVPSSQKKIIDTNTNTVNIVINDDNEQYKE